MIELCLFYNGLDSARLAQDAGVDYLVVDCEFHGKQRRQEGFDTEINEQTPADVAVARAVAPEIPILCRINSLTENSARSLDEARAAVNNGANEILLPMVRSLQEVERSLTVVGSQAQIGLMLETEWALEHARELDQFPLSRVFVGLSDLMVERRSRNLFENVWNGTVAQVRGRILSARFGFGGLTIPEGGAPIPCLLLMSELARMRCDFTFLRRSFYRDLAAGPDTPSSAVIAIRTAWERMLNRSLTEQERDRKQLWSLFETRLGLISAGIRWSGDQFQLNAPPESLDPTLAYRSG